MKRTMTIRRVNLRAVLDVTAAVAMLIASAVIVHSLAINGGTPPAGPPNVVPETPLDIGDAEFLGDQAAGVILLEFSDFQCPFCGQFARTTLPRLEQHYVNTGQVQLVYRHLPIEQLHPQAVSAASAAACAARQGKFWSMHDALFRNQTELDRRSIDARAAVLGLELSGFEACRNTLGIDRVRADLAIAEEIGIKSTPYFLIGRRDPQGRLLASRSVLGARPFADFAAVLDELLADSESNQPTPRGRQAPTP